MTRIAGPDVISHLKVSGLYEHFVQEMAKNRCDICQRLFEEHSPEEFNAHALGDVTIDVDIVPATPNQFQRR